MKLASLLSLTLLFAPAPLFGAAAHHDPCSASPVPNQPAFAVHHYLYDPAQKQRWAVVVDCLHPQWPPVLEPVDETLPEPDSTPLSSASSPVHPSIGPAHAGSTASSQSSSSNPWLLAGAKVRLWKDGQVRIQLSGIAIESAPPGAAVGVRVGESGIVLHGIVRGPDSVQLVEGDSTWRQ